MKSLSEMFKIFGKTPSFPCEFFDYYKLLKDHKDTVKANQTLVKQYANVKKEEDALEQLNSLKLKVRLMDKKEVQLFELHQLFDCKTEIVKQRKCLSKNYSADDNQGDQNS